MGLHTARRASRSPLSILLALSGLTGLTGLHGCDRAAATPDSAPLLAVHQELRVGSVDDPETMLTRANALYVDERGRIYTSHPQEHRVLVHGADGRRVRSLGSEGEGPGEFRALGGLGIQGDTLWVFDYRLYRISYFSTDGDFLGSRRIEIDLGSGPSDSPPRPAGMLPTGELYGSSPAWSREVVAGRITEIPVLRMDTLGRPLDTLFVQSHVNTVWAIESGSNGWGMYRDQPFDDAPLVQLSAYEPVILRVDRAATPDAAPAFTVTKLSYQGDTIFSRSYPYAPRPIDPATVDSVVRAFADAAGNAPFAGAPEPARAVRLARDGLHLPDHHPPVREGVVGRDGSIWMQREDQGEPTTEWLVLDPGGEPYGRIRLPRTIQPMAVEQDRLWGIERDDLDVPYIVRYRLSPPEEPARSS